MVRVRLVQGLRLLPGQSMPVEVELSCQELNDTHCSLLFEPDSSLQENSKVHVEDGLLQVKGRLQWQITCAFY